METYIPKGQRIIYSRWKSPPHDLSDYLKDVFTPLNSIQGFCLVYRRNGFLSLNKIRAIVLFYDDDQEYEKENLILSKKFEDYFSDVSYFIDLVSMDMKDDLALTLAKNMEDMGVEIVETNNESTND
ncbi:hypothetical protein KFE98_00470 [bacterium SCSIO 12741]|nr:hypothetical protein KFE98_00470 [bacterium SCSIO 12741]